MIDNLEKGLTYDDIQIIPQYSEVESRSECDIETELFKDVPLRVPVLSAPMDSVTGPEMAIELYKLGASGIIHRFDDIETQANLAASVKNEIERRKANMKEQVVKNDAFDLVDDIDYPGHIIAAIGATGDYFERANELVERGGVSALCIDVAHGHHKYVKDALEKLRKYTDIPIIAGNVCTLEGARDLANWGAAALRIGIGNGSVCETRIRAGVGTPQVTAIREAVRGVEQSNNKDCKIIADGGIRTPGDAAKAIALGADSVMIGGLFSGTKETPGKIVREGRWPNEALYKEYRGSASEASKKDRGEENHVEGNSIKVKYRGKIKRILSGVTDGLKSSMSYTGAKTLDEFRAKVKFIRITQAGQFEAKPHAMIEHDQK